MVHCVKLDKEAEGLDRAPVKGPLGQRIYEQVSKEAWKQWISHSTMLVNEYRLELGTPEASRVWLAELEKFFFGEGSSAPQGYVPPSEGAAPDAKPDSDPGSEPREP